MKTESDKGLLPAGFQFSQASLQDFVDCPRRFQLRYLERRAWPALISEPALEYERRQMQGAAFHRMVQQHLTGIPAQRLSEMIPAEDGSRGADDLCRWWNNYLGYAPADRPGNKYVEYALSSPAAGFRLLAKYDLLIVEPERTNGETIASRATILDWKTSAKKARRPSLAVSLQTRVYRYILVTAGRSLNGGTPFQPDQIQMVYWFANEPDQPEAFVYTQALFDDDDRVLRSLIGDIAMRGKDSFPVTVHEKRCLFCVYRSLCERGVCAGNLEDEDEETQIPETLELDLDSIEEIAF